MGPTGLSATNGALLLLFLLRGLLLRHRVTPLPIPARPAVDHVRTVGEAEKRVKGKIPNRGVATGGSPHILGGAGRLALIGLLVCGGRLAVLAPLHVLLVERHALLAERTALGRVGGEIAAHQTEDLLAIDLALLGAAPQGPNTDHLAA